SLNQFADNTQYFLKNFYLKSKRSILKPKTEGPAAYVFASDDPRLGPQAELLRVLQLQKVEISRATKEFTVRVPGKTRPNRQLTNDEASAAHGPSDRSDQSAQRERPAETGPFPARSYICPRDPPV